VPKRPDVRTLLRDAAKIGRIIENMNTKPSGGVHANTLAQAAATYGVPGLDDPIYNGSDRACAEAIADAINAQVRLYK